MTDLITERNKFYTNFEKNLLKITKQIRAENEGKLVQDISMKQIASFERYSDAVEVWVSYCGGYFYFYSYPWRDGRPIHEEEDGEVYYKFHGRTYDSPIENIDGEEMYDRTFDWGKEVDATSIVTYREEDK